MLQARIHYRLHSCVDFIKSYSAALGANKTYSISNMFLVSNFTICWSLFR